MDRRTVLQALVGGSVWLLAARPLGAQVVPGSSGVSLRDILEKRLRVRFESERQFIARLLPHVGPGKPFSRTEVLALMYKALRYNANFPFPYFRTMIQILAARRGVRL